MSRAIRRVACVVLLLGCESPVESGQTADAVVSDADAASTVDSGAADASPDRGERPFTVVTFNSGTTTGLNHDGLPDDGYGSAEAELSDQLYGDGLAWSPAIDSTRAFFDALEPDVVVFQEIFHPDDCASIPEASQTGFVCERWTPGDPTVAQRVLGPGWQVMCHPGKPDKCAAVRRSFGRFRGCEADLCLEGLMGATVEGCGRGARIGRGLIELETGGELTLINVHGSSGLGTEDTGCRVKQVEQVFVDLGDGDPGANGMRNLVMGDLNTDPGRLAAADPSAARWNDFVGPERSFHFISDVGPDAAPTYANLLSIDHVMSDAFDGRCWAPGLTPGEPGITSMIYFDHVPVVCEILAVRPAP